ncbi:MAG: SET domain-containing protein-lysine N-methyltransferase [Thermoleophilia bacterium]
MNDGFELRVTDGRGEGIFSTRSFKTHEIVMVGMIDKVLDGNHSHASQIGKNDYVLHAGSISKVNHSCDPNCGISVNETGAHDFVAIREIIADEEITFDYAMRNYGIGYFPKQCGCGSKGCRGEITGWKDLPEERKKYYEGFVAPYLLELDARLESQEADILLVK